MSRLVLALAALVTATAVPARADTLPLIVGLPTEYTAGTPFTFELRAPGLVDFSAYSLELLFETQGDSTSTLSVSATRGVTPDYAFPLGSFQSNTTIESGGTIHRLQVSDTGPMVNTTANVNDLLALVTVTPSLGFTGTIQLSVDGGSLVFLVNSEVTPEILPPENIPVINPAAPPTNGVPTPAAWVSMAIGLAILGLRRKTVRASVEA
jgi:hypothetical protein